VDAGLPGPAGLTRAERVTALTRPLDGRRALVMGGGSGIGLATAGLLARDGARVTIAGRTEVALRDAAEVLRADAGPDVAWVVADALDGDQVAAAVDAASDDQRHLHIAVVVPGGGAVTPVLLFGDDAFSAQVDANVRPVFLVLKYAGRAMVRAGGGAFVAVSSTAAALSTRYLASYAAGKAAVDQLVRVAADELGEHGVRVNSVRPGLTRTPATARALAQPRMAAAFLAGQPLARHGEVDDVAQAIRYLAGPESSWVTAQHLAVDGGHTLRAFVDYAALLDVPDQADAARREDGPDAARRGPATSP
jgi:NAD(P)-dependent dehydrogenase (short-subunit alcohol dehydrogenase family)